MNKTTEPSNTHYSQLPSARSSPSHAITYNMYDMTTLFRMRKADPPEEYAAFTCGPKELDIIFTKTKKAD